MTSGSTRQPWRLWTARARLALILCGLAVLSGCGWFSSGPSTTQPRMACPPAAVLRPLSQTAVFAPGAPRQPTGVAFYGVLSDIDAKCDRAGDVLRLSLDTVIIGERGPASGGATAVDLHYFVAVMGRDETILAKRTLPVRIAVPAEAQRAGVTDHVEEAVALSGRPPGELTIVLGFQQSPEVVEFYRRFRGR